MKTIVSPSGKITEWDGRSWDNMIKMEDGWYFFIHDGPENLGKSSVALFVNGVYKKSIVPSTHFPCKEDLERWIKLQAFE